MWREKTTCLINGGGAHRGLCTKKGIIDEKDPRFYLHYGNKHNVPKGCCRISRLIILQL